MPILLKPMTEREVREYDCSGRVDSDPLFPIREAADYCHVDRTYLYRLIRQGRLRVIEYADRQWVALRDLRELLDQNETVGRKRTNY